MPELISFSTVQLKSGVTPLTAPNELASGDIGTTTSVANRALAALAGDGDKLLESGETGYVLSGFGTGDRLASSATLNTPADPVTITANGRQHSNVVGALVTDGTITANSIWGFGLDNGIESTGRFLNDGDSITWALNARAGVPQALVAFSFVIDRNGSTAATEVAFDFDGNVLRSGTYLRAQNADNADAALRLVANGGDTVAVNFATGVVTVNGLPRTGADIDALFAAFRASPQTQLTIGSITSAGFSVRDLVLERDNLGLPPDNAAPSLALADTTTSLAANTVIATPLKVADIMVSDDGVGRNTLSLTGADAALFQISGTALYLRAGVVLDIKNNPTLDVSVVVDDSTIGSGPDATADLGISLTANNQGRISFALVQLKSGVTAMTAPNELGASDLGQTTSTTNRALVAIVGDGDKLLEGDESAFVLAGAGSASRITYSDRLNSPADPVSFAIHGRINATSVGAMSPDSALRHDAAWGFGIDNGPDTSGRLLNGGDSITFTLNDKASVAQKLTGFRFVVDTNGGTAATEVAFDFDGNVVKTGSYGASQNSANADAALRLAANNGDVIAVDFVNRVLTVNGNAVSTADITAFFAAHDLAAQNIVTLGSLGSTGFSLRDLVLDRADVVAVPVNLPPTVSLTNVTATLPENTDMSLRLKVGDISVSDDGLGTNTLSLGGADAALFELDGTGLYLKAGVTLDYETRQNLNVSVLVDDASLGASPDAIANLSLAISDVNEAPGLGLTNALTTLAENTVLTTPLKVADIGVTDDALGTNQLSLTGDDAAMFEINGNGLYLRAGVALDFESNPQLDVRVQVDDPALGTGAEAEAAFTLGLTDVAETYGLITLDGALADWAGNTRLDTPTTGAPGTAVYGTYQGDSFVLALKVDAGSIGPNTTIWFNTDMNAATGFQVFGSTVGAEYNINIGPDGRPALYTGAAGATLVSSTLDFAFNADRSVLEIALPSGLLAGAPRQTNLALDINDATFLPNDYAGYTFQVGEQAPLLPKDPGTRVAIVYSETTANAYFDKTAYGQLFMAAQNQAMQAGIPFDLISESALTDIATLVKYDSIIMPGLSNVRAADLAAISTTLTSAVKDYGIGIVTMGNFLTNDETGAAFSGDAYARMKLILGVTLDGFGDTAGVTLRAVDGAHPVTDLYGTGEVVGTYNTTSYLTFRDVSGSGRTLFTQDVDGATTAPATVAGVIATTINDARNVQFATDALFGNNNILSEAINWSARGSTPDVGLQMTRGSSLFYSRDDMDQAQETFDVQSSPGIYDTMLPIVEKWFADYGFVGSYYLDIGADAPDQQTDWAISKPYYDRLLAMGSEIGTHSFTHPANTNTLLPDSFTEVQRQAWLAGLDPAVAPNVRNALTGMTLAFTQSELTRLLALTDPASPTAVDPSGLSDVEREILKGSFRFQFDYSRQIIERELGITLDGVAVPGAPEKLGTALEILKYAGYLTGGYSGVGAGYPGAFGFLSPDRQEQVYLAPNVTFDFSLIGFRGLTAAQAEAVWAAEYAAIIAKGTTPIIEFPWHDYGPTNWPDGTSLDPGYRLAMYTNFIARAAADGTEFLTGRDLAQRIESFAASKVEISTSGATVTAKVTGSDVGRFALDVDTTQVIASVKDWYAFDGAKVFLPRTGGTFEITLGTEAADVTRIAALPMRAELVSAIGDGTNLSFALNGQGTATVALKTWGTQSVVASGADSGTLAGDMLSLAFAALGGHNVAIAYTAAGADQVVGTSGNDVIVGSTGDSTIAGGLGDDALYGNGGADTFVFAKVGGKDVVQDFSAAAGDMIELVNSGFASASAALAAFVQTAEGLLLTYSAVDQLLIANATAANLSAGNIVLTNDLPFA